jgi:hypothetical protein
LNLIARALKHSRLSGSMSSALYPLESWMKQVKTPLLFRFNVSGSIPRLETARPGGWGGSIPGPGGWGPGGGLVSPGGCGGVTSPGEGVVASPGAGRVVAPVTGKLFPSSVPGLCLMVITISSKDEASVVRS